MRTLRNVSRLAASWSAAAATKSTILHCSTTRRGNDGPASPSSSFQQRGASGGVRSDDYDDMSSSFSQRRGDATALEVDDSDDWFSKQVQRAVKEQKTTPEAASYFASVIDTHPELRLTMRESRKMIGDQDPSRMSAYQKKTLTENITTFGCNIAADRMRKSFADETATRSYAKEGKPTGQEFWFENKHLQSLDMPLWMRDEMLEEMQSKRPADSPAFEQPKEGQFTPEPVSEGVRPISWNSDFAK